MPDGPAPIRRFQNDFGPVQAHSQVGFCVDMVFFCDVMELTGIADVNNGWSECIIPFESIIYARIITPRFTPCLAIFLIIVYTM